MDRPDIDILILIDRAVPRYHVAFNSPEFHRISMLLYDISGVSCQFPSQYCASIILLIRRKF
jgi:hypothetical protein